METSAKNGATEDDSVVEAVRPKEWARPTSKTVMARSERCYDIGSVSHDRCPRCGHAGHHRAQCVMVTFKTRICWHWSIGTCRAGGRCTFAHGEEELRPLQCVSNCETNVTSLDTPPSL